MSSHRVVQTVLIQRAGRGGFTRGEASREVRRLGYSSDDLDDSKPNFWRFRQVNPRDIAEGSYYTALIKPGVQFVYGQLAQPRARANPTPTAWTSLGPNRPYGCKTDLIGKHIPGVRGRGGVVTSCATPPRAAYAKTENGLRLGSDPRHIAHRKGQLMLERGGKQWPVTREYAARKLRELERGTGHGERGEHPHEIEGRLRDLDSPDHVPMPLGLHFPHRAGSSVCAPDHPMWNSEEWNDILVLAGERAARRAEDLGIPTDIAAGGFRANRSPVTTYEAIFAEEVRRDRRSRKYYEAERKCVEWLRSQRRGGSGYSSPQHLAQQRRRLAIQAGVDTTSADYLDELSKQSRAKSLRKPATRRKAATKGRKKR